MKLILPLLLLTLNSFSQTTCKSFTKDGFKIVYNKYYKKYAVVHNDTILGERVFLMKNHSGRYSIYTDRWDEYECWDCVDKSKSLFSDPCKAKQFLIEYYKRKKDDYWN